MSALDRPRRLHASGVTFEARFRPDTSARVVLPGAQLLERDEDLATVVRFSRAFAIPGPVDYVGLAIEVTDAYGPGLTQDIILVSSPAAPCSAGSLSPSRCLRSGPRLPARRRRQPLQAATRLVNAASVRRPAGPSPGPAAPRRPDGAMTACRMDPILERLASRVTISVVTLEDLASAGPFTPVFHQPLHPRAGRHHR